MEAQLATPCGRGRYVIVAGHPIEMPGPGGKEACMLFTFADLEDRRKAEMALRHSEERFAKAFELSPAPGALMGADGLRIISVNQAFATTFGHSADAAGGRSLSDLMLWVDLAEQRKFARELKRLGSVRGYEAALRHADGAEIDSLVSAERVSIDGEACVLCVLQDITARKRSERELIGAIEAVMADASWFSHGVIGKLAALRNPSRAGGQGGRDREPDCPRGRHAQPHLPGRHRQGDRGRAEAVPEHRAQSRRRSLPQARGQPPQRGRGLGAGTRPRAERAAASLGWPKLVTKLPVRISINILYVNLWNIAQFC